MTLTTTKDSDSAWPRYRVSDAERGEIGTIALHPTERVRMWRAVFKARRHVELTVTDLRAIVEILAALMPESNPGSTP